jgi:hypothetical protein
MQEILHPLMDVGELRLGEQAAGDAGLFVTTMTG